MMKKILWEGQPSQLPVDIEYTPMDSNETMFYLAGSAWTGTDGGKMIGYRVTLDGNDLLQTQIFSNTKGEHRATTPGLCVKKVPFELKTDENGLPVKDENGNLHAKVVTFRIEVMNEDTLADYNDWLVFARV